MATASSSGLPRKITKVWKSQPSTEVAGVHLRRAFGFREVPQLDPFLLLDDFKSENPEDTLILYGPGDQIAVSTEKRPVRFLLVSGRPLKEPVAWHGPIVMNSQRELRTAFQE